MNLRPVNNTGNGYCGPAAVSIITGLGTAEAASLMRAHSGATFIKSASYGEVFAAFRALGCVVEEATDLLPAGHWARNRKDQLTFLQWIRSTRGKRGNDMLLVADSSHYRVVRGTAYNCSMTKEPVHVADAPRQRSRIERVWRVRKVGPVQPSVTAVTTVKKATDAQRAAQKARARAKALIALHPQIEAEVERSDGEFRIWVTCPFLENEACDPLGVLPGDIYEGDHIVDGWVEALERVEGYVAELAKNKALA